MPRKLTALLSAGAIAALALAAALPSQQAQAQESRLTIARTTDAESLDPYLATAGPSVWVYANIFDTLVIQDRDLDIKPGLAESWEVVEPETWRFHLRKGVTFHDGTPFDAAAVKFTFDRALDEKAPARGLSMAGPISKVEVVDDYTVDISTPKPYGPMLKAMSEVFVFGIVSPAAVEKHGKDFGLNPVGTGPFKFASWDRNNQIVLEKNADYWGGAPAIDTLVFKVIPEASSQLISYGTGEVDGVMAPDASIIQRLAAEPNSVVYDVPGLRLLHVGFNTKKPVFEDVRVRRAVAHAINREALAKGVLRGSATVAEGYLPRQAFGFHDVGSYDYDPEKAKALLAEAGWTPGSDGKLQKDGKPLTITYWGYTGRDPSSRLISEAIQGDLQKLGITVDLRIWDYGQLSSAIWQEHPSEGAAATEYDMFALGWTTITGDADFTLYGTLSDLAIPPQGLNATFFAPEEYMEALNTGRFSTDPKERAAAYKKALEMLHENAVWQPLVVVNLVAAFKDYVKGYEPHPVEYYMLRMKDVRIEK